MKMFGFDVMDERFGMVRRASVGFAAAGLLSVTLAGGALAETGDSVAAAGNGGSSGSDADGGSVTVGTVEPVDSGSTGSVITVEGVPVGDDLAATIIASILGTSTDDTAS
jgi:hypothetical protein